MSLDTNWRFSGNYYISQRDGNDSNDASKASPKKTVGSAVLATPAVKSIYLRSGIYNEGDYVATPIILQVIGELSEGVIFDGSGFTNLILNYGNAPTSIRNVTVQNYSGVFQTTTTFLYDSVIRNVGNLVNLDIMQRCLFKNCIINSYITRRLVANNTYSQVTISSTNTTTVFDKCVFDGITTVGVGTSSKFTFKNCAFDDGFSFTDNLIGTIVSQSLDGESSIGTTYLDGEKFSGVITSGAVTLIFEDCFWTADLMFNDPASDDYTPKYLPGNPEVISPLWNNGNVIGAYYPCFRITGLHPAFQVGNGAVLSNITVGGSGEFSITSGTEGTVTSSLDPTTAIELPYSIKLNEAIRFFGDFNYSAGEWIDKANYNSGDANPEVRLTYELQYVNEVTGLFNGQWIPIEVNSIPQIDNTGKGNGDIDVDFTRVGQISAKRFALRFTLRNNGV